MEQETQTIQSDQPGISLQDLVLILNLIRITAERGAIKADEMSSVGTVYEKLFAFLKNAGVIKTAEETTSEQ